jgi:hypothetical protein
MLPAFPWTVLLSGALVLACFLPGSVLGQTPTATNLQTGIPSSLSEARFGAASACWAGTCVVAGGKAGSLSVATADFFEGGKRTLVEPNALGTARSNLRGCAADGVLVFGGGHYGASATRTGAADFYDEAGKQWFSSPSLLTAADEKACAGPPAGSTTDIVVFAGGYGGGYRTDAQAVNVTLRTVQANAVMKSTKRIREQAASVVDSGGVEYLVLGGGTCGFGCYSNEVEILRFDTLSWHSVAPVPTLSQPRVDGGGGGVGGKAVFYTGLYQNGGWSMTMDIFDSNANFARSTVALSTEQLNSVLIPYGDRYLLVAGGSRGAADYYSTIVDVVDVQTETVTNDTYRLAVGVRDPDGATRWIVPLRCWWSN